jgi:Skp family chaperone for outer membrane proteins
MPFPSTERVARDRRSKGSRSPVKEDPTPQQGALNVKKYLLSTAVTAAIFTVCFAGTCLTDNPASAQAPAVSQGMPMPVGLVDVNFILKNHTRLTDAKNKLKAEADKIQKDFEAQLADVANRAKQLGPGGYKPGSPEYNELEERLSKEQAAIKTNIAHKRREFVEREAKLLYDAYVEVNREVQAYCQARGIAVVLNFDHESIRDDSPENVARGITNPVVFFNRDFDITPAVMQRFVRPVVATPAQPSFR